MAEAAHPTSTTPSGGCPTHPPAPEAPPLFQNGELTFQAHHVGWIVASFFAIIATAVSIWLIIKHLSWYTNPKQQRQIVRLLMMVPIYAIISCLAYFFWNHAIPLSLIRDAYEGIILAAFFYLILEYLAPTAAEQKEWFRTFVLKKWAWPLGWVKRKPEGLYFLQSMKWAILQYCWVRPLTTFAAIILDWMGIYCEESWSPQFGSVWVLIVVSISVTVAMYCLIQLYIAISDEIKQHRPLLQLFSVKAIIFLMFWQSAFLSALHSYNVIKDTKYMSAEDINVGFAALLQTFEMMLFAFLHVRCFSYIPYRKEGRTQQTKKGRAFLNVLNFSDFWKETRDGLVYLWHKARGKEADFAARRRTHFERAMGKSRTMPDVKKEFPQTSHPPGDDDISDEEMPFTQSQLMPGAKIRDNMSREAPRRSKEKNREKSKLLDVPPDEEMAISRHERRQRSWWDRIHDRLSTDGQNDDQYRVIDTGKAGKVENTRLQLPSHKANIRAYASRAVDLDEPPPPSLLGRRQRPHRDNNHEFEAKPFLDWGPTSTQLPTRLSDNDKSKGHIISNIDLGDSPANTKVQERDDGLFGRLFSRSRESSVAHEESNPNHAANLPSLFQRKQDVVSAVKDWILPPVKSTSAGPDPLQKPTPTPPERPDSIPSIPSLSPSPPPITTAARQPRQDQVIAIATVPAPAQPVPVLHQSLSRARKPGILIADEAGVSPPDIVKPQPKVRTSEWIDVISPPGNARGSSLLQNLPQNVHARGPDPRSYEGRHNSQGIRGPRRPKKLVMPTPLSPARYPAGATAPLQPMITANNPYPNLPRTMRPDDRYVLPPGAGYGPAVAPRRPPATSGPALQAYKPIPSGNVQPTFDPYRDVAPVEPHISTRSHQPPRQSRPSRRRSDFVDNHTPRGSRNEPRKSRSNSPFGIEAISSDSESLPRHPALRQHTARRRRQSQPLPEIPPSEAVPEKALPIPTSPHPTPEDGMPSRPLDPDNLASPSLLESPLSSNGDTRYPQGTSRPNYFDSYDTVAPYLTNIMDEAPGSSEPPPIVSSPSGTAATRRKTRR